MSKGKSWAKGYKAKVKGVGCPNGKAKCYLCSNPEAVAYKTSKSSPLSDDWGIDLDDDYAA